MDCVNDILASRMVNSRVWVVIIERIVATPLIGAKQADFVGDRFADERGESIRYYVRDYPRDHIPLAADRAHDWSFAGADTPGSTAAAVLRLMASVRDIVSPFQD